ncbi:MAG: hypothetical protein WEE89_05760 [Gemmatimonadota bacterium]
MARAAAAVLAITALLPNALAAQNPGDPSPDTITYGVRAPSWGAQAGMLGVNALFGGLTAGLFQELRGGSFKDGFTRGALGGSVTYFGKRVASRRFQGAGFIGREVAAVGSSIVRNASEARPTLETLVFPLGPVRVQVRPKGRRPIDASLDVMGSLWLAYAISEPELEFETRVSLSAGAPVFRTRNKLIVFRANRLHAGGITPAATILRSYVPAWGTPFLERVLAHERVHVEQEDQIFHTLIEPAEVWLFGHVPYGDRIARHADFNVSSDVLAIMSQLFKRHADRPWELEAIYLSR